MTYQFGLDRPRWRVAVQSTSDETVPGETTFEHWLKERSRGCRRARHDRLRVFDVAHPVWSVRAVRAAEVDVDFAALYGAEWAVLDAQAPASVLYAVGSDVTVSAPS